MTTWFNGVRRSVGAIVGMGAVFGLLAGGMPARAEDLNPVKTGRVCQFDAGDGITSDGSGVLTWADQSGNGHNGTRSAGNPTLVAGALNGRPIVQFRGNDDRLDVADNLFTKEQYVVVRSPNVNWNEHGAFLGRRSGRESNYLTQQGQKNFHGNQYPAQVHRNGVDVTAAMGDANQLNPITDWMILKIVVNDNNTSPALYWIGRGDYNGVECDIAEIIGYSTTLSAADEDLVGGYLSWKYNITTSYPAWSPSAVGWTTPGVDSVTLHDATVSSTLSVDGDDDADVTIYWGTADAGATNTGWTGTAVNLGNRAEGVVSGTIPGLSPNTVYYFRFYGIKASLPAPNSYFSKAGTFRTPAADEWTGVANDLWGNASNWASTNVPNASGESARFVDKGVGDVDLGGAAYTIRSVAFDGGGYTVLDTNATPGTLTMGALTNSAGANTIAVGMAISGAAAVSGGALSLNTVSDLSAGQFRLSGGTLVLRDVGVSAVQAETWDFETGDLAGWTVVPYTGGGSDDAFRYGHQPQNNEAHLGNWGINTWGQENPNGNSDYYTGIIQTDPFYIAEAGTVSFQICTAPFAFTGDPDSPNPNMACVTLEREVSPGDWTMIYSATHGYNFNWESKSWDTTPYVGSTVRFRIYDTHTGGWGHTAVDNIVATGIQQVEKRPFSLTGIPVNVVGAAALQADCDTNTAALGALMMANGATLATSSGSPVGFEGTTIAAGATSVGFAAGIDTYLTRAAGLNGSGSAAVVAKTGTGRLILNRAGSNLGSVMFDVQAGALVAVDTGAFGGAFLSLNGGTLLLSSPSGSTVHYAKSVSVVSDSTLAAGVAGNGKAGPLTVYLDGSVDFGGTQTLALTASDSYVLRLTGQINGVGTLSLESGTVQIDDPSFNAVQMNGGSLTVPGNLTVSQLIQSSGSFTMAGASKDLAVSDTLTLAGLGDFRGGPNLVLTTAAVTLSSGASLLYDKALAAASLTIENGGTLDIGTHALSVGTLTWRNGGSLTCGPITASGSMSFWPERTIANKLSGTGDVYIGEPADTWGYVALTGTNDYTGMTEIQRAKLRATEGVGLPAASRLVFNSDHPISPCVWQTRGTITRDIGSAGGEVYWAGGWGGGFASFGGPLTVSLEGNSALSWSDGSTGFSDSESIQLGSLESTDITELTNPISLEGARGECRIFIGNNPDSTLDFVRLSGVISGSGDWLRFSQIDWGGGDNNTFFRGLVELTATNTYTRRTAIEGTTLAAADGVGLPAASTVYFRSPDGAWYESILMSSGVLARNIGDGAGEINWHWGSGGFAARGGDLAVTLEGGSTLSWWDGSTGFNGQWLLMNSQYASNRVEITNPIDLGGGEYYVSVFDNPATDQDVAELSGGVAGNNHGARFTKFGPGTLCLSGANTFDQYLGIDWGAVRFDSQAEIPAGTTITFWEWQRGWDWPKNVECQGVLALDIGRWNDAGKVSWEWGAGGFAAYGGPLTLNLQGGATIPWDTWDGGFSGRPVHLGSRTANDVVTFANTLDTRGGWRQLVLWDNPHAAGDYAVVSNITSSSGTLDGHLQTYGDGTLKIAGTIDNMNYLRAEDSSTIQINGTFNGRYVDSNNGQLGQSIRRYPDGGATPTIGGSGTINASEVRLRSWSDTSYSTLAPGASVGTLTINGNLVFESSYCRYDWELGPAGGDQAAVSGSLDLGTGWTVKLIRAGGTPRADQQYVLFTYDGACTYVEPTIDASAVPADWVTSGATVVHDTVNKRIYLTGVYSVLSVANTDPTDLTSTSATLEGFVSAQADPLYVSVYWGTSDGGTNAAAWLSGGYKADKGTCTGVSGQSVSHPVTGLNTNELWYYTWRATNASGTLNLWGQPSIAFRALGPPVVTNTGASGIDVGVATLNGAFRDHNRGTVTFYWGTADGGTDPAGWQQSENVGEQSAASFAAGIRDVLYPLGYVYRIQAVNPYGTSWSAAASFSQTGRPGPHLPVTARKAAAWFDASLGTTSDGSGVATWLDQSGFGHDATRNQGTTQLRANQINGRPAVEFAGNAYMTMAGTLYSKDQFIVTKMNGGDWGAWMGSDQRGGYMWNQNGNCWDANIPSAVSKNGTALPSYPYYLGDDRAAKFMLLRIRGNDNNLSIRTYYLGRTEGWVSLNNYMAEIIAYSNALSAADEAQVGGYLAQKYGIAGYAPVDVPYQDAPAISNLKPTRVGIASGTMNALLSCSGAVYNAWVHWGDNDGGTTVGGWDHHAFVGTVTGAVATVSKAVTTGVGTWYYTYQASNELDQLWAAPSTNFTTVTEPSVNNAAGAVTNLGTASLRGDLTAGNQADLYVYWGRTNGGTTPGSWEYVVRMPDTLQGAFQATVNAGYGFPQYYYRCFASNEAGTAWAPATANFTMPAPVWFLNGFEETIFNGSIGDAQSNIEQFRAAALSIGPSDGQGVLSTRLHYEDDNSFSVRAAELGAVGFDNGDFAALWVCEFAPTQSGQWGFRIAREVDDNTSWWVDTDGNGTFEIANRFYNRGCCGASGDQLTPALTAGARYAFGVVMNDTGGGGWFRNFQFKAPGGDWTDVDPSSPAQNGLWRVASLPQLMIANAPVSNLATNSARLNGTMMAAASGFDVYVCYGRTDGGTVASSWETKRFVGTVYNLTVPTALQYDATGLARTSQYYYAFLATNTVTNLWAQPSTVFQTLGPTVAENGPVTGITQTRATLAAQLTRGGQGTLKVYWGLTDGGTDPLAWQNTNSFGTVLIGTYSTTVTVRAGAPYYYRAFAANAYGEDWADATGTFMTALPNVSLSVRTVLEPGFSPTNVAGCVLWLRADQGVVADGSGNVQTWNDQSGRGNHAVPGNGDVKRVAGQINGLPAVTFRNQHLAINTPMVVKSEYIVFKSGRYAYDAVNPNAWGPDWSAPLGRQDQEHWMLQPNARQLWDAWRPLAVATNGTPVGEEVGLGWYGMTTVDRYMLMKADPQSTSSATYYLGRNGGYQNGYFDIAEVIAFDVRLSSADENRLGQYLAAKYGLGTTYTVFSERGGQSRVTATLSAPSVSNVTVNFAFDGYKGTDYEASTNRIVIPAGSLSAEITLTGLDDALPEEDETLAISIQSLHHAADGVPAVVAPQVTSDEPEVTNGDGASGVTENSATISGLLTLGDNAAVMVYFGDNDGGTTAASWDAAFAQGVQSEDFGFGTNLTGLVANKTYYYRCHATNGSLLGQDWADSTASFDTAQPSVGISDVSVTEGNGGSVSATFTLTLSTVSAIPVSVRCTAADGTAVSGVNYAPASAVVTIPAEQPGAQFTVTVLGNTTFEVPDKYFVVDLTDATGCTIADAQGVGTILDDDAAGYLAGWSNWMEISFDSYAGSSTLTNWPALVRLSTAIPGFSYGSFASATGGDLRFTTADGKRVLKFEIERWVTNGESVVWVQVPVLPAGGTVIKAYWNNPAEPTLPSYATDGSVWADGYASVWHMNEPSTRDASLRGHDGTAQGDVQSVAGVIGRGNDFNTGEYILVPSSTDWYLQSRDFTMSAWVNSRETGGEHGIFGTWGSQFIFAVRDGNVSFHANGQVFWPSTAGVAQNSWKYVTITRTGRSWKVLVDGVVGDSNPQNGGDRSIDSYRELNIGSGGQDWRGWWNGMIDEPRIETKWRSTDWVKANYDNQRPNSTFITYGTINGNPLPPPPEIAGGSVTIVGGVVAFEFETTAGARYRLLYKDALADPEWLPILYPPAFPPPDGWSAVSSGETMTILDTNAPDQSQRFYRIGAGNP